MGKRRICVICFENCFPSNVNSQFEKLTASLLNDNGLPDNLMILACSKCVTFVTSALKTREKVNGKEESVRRIQLQILKLRGKVGKMLRELEGAIGEFKEEVGELEEILEESQKKSGELEEYFKKEDSEKVEELVKEANELRKAVFTVFQDLHAYRTFLGNRPGTGRPQINLEEPEITTTSSDKTEHGDGPNRPRRRCAKRSKYVEVKVQAEELGDSDASCIKGISPTADLGDDYDHDDIFEHGGDEPMSPVVDIEEDNGDNGNQDKNGSGCEVDDDDENNGSDYNPEKDESTVNSEVKSIYSKFNLGGMSLFKKAMIYHAVRKSVAENKQSTGTVYDTINPLKLHPMTYEPTTDNLVIAGIQISIMEQQKTFQCLECGEILQKSEPKRQLYNHVLGYHLNLFQCPLCPSQMKDYITFKSHVLGHGGKYTCHICGKPLKRSDTLKHHKWTHKSEEEKQEAIKNGEKPHSRPSKNLASAGTFMCSTCGKGPFGTLSQLRKHERRHQEPKHLCPQCGKKFTTISILEHHQRLVCPVSRDPEERMKARRFICDLCPKRFFNKNQLKLHKISMHTDIRPFKCNYCDKMFKLEGLRKTHEKTHFDTRTFPCGNGCGALFKRRDHATRHEKTCTTFFKCDN